MKQITLLLFLTTSIIFLCTSCGESTEFCGEHFTAPSECEATGNLIKCNHFVFAWTYEPVADLPRHKKHLLAQMHEPKEVKVSVINTDLVGYVSKVETFESLLIIGEVNGQGVIISLFVDKPIKST